MQLQQKILTPGEVKELEIRDEEGVAIATLSNKTKVKANLPSSNEWWIESLVQNQLVDTMRFLKPPIYLQILGPAFIFILPILVVIFLYMLMMRQAQATGGQALSFGKSRAKMLTDNKPNVTFKDVAGIEEAVEELYEVVEFLREKKKFVSLGAKIPKGVLLVGPPGCGKTLLARAIAGEAGVPFFHMSGSDFVEMFVGVGASRVRDLFDQAKRHSPSIVFVDEIDAVGRQRGAGLGGGHDEREQTLNQLLVEMDGFDPNLGVIILAATNRPDILDPALLRPGRFDRRIVVDKPDVKGREDILKIHTRETPLGEDVDLKVIARRTPGFTGADLHNLVNEAAILAARQNRKKLAMEQFEEATDRVIAGPERRSRVISEKEKIIIAFHEAGHALVMYFSGDMDPVHKISILPRGMALGYTLQLPLEDRYLTTKDELILKIKGALGGRAAEELIYNEQTTGAHDDLRRITDLARRMVMEFGMSESLGPRTYGRQHHHVFLGRDIAEERDYSEDIAKAIDMEVNKIIISCYEDVKRLIEDNRPKLEALAHVLLEREMLIGEEIKLIMEGKTLPAKEKSDSGPTPPQADKKDVPVTEESEKLKHRGLSPEPA
jgi:cell division protease FtsH